MGQWRDHTVRLESRYRSGIERTSKDAAVTALEELKARVRRINPSGFDRCSHLSEVMGLIIGLQKEIHNHGE